MRIGIATIAAARARHLSRQADAIRRLDGLERYVVVSMDDDPAHATVGGDLIRISNPASAALPLAAARNLAIGSLADMDLVIMLDVDCIPSQALIDRYAEATRCLGSTPALHCGPVGYLAPMSDDQAAPTPDQLEAARRRVVRRFPRAGLRRERRHELFWSVSFALAPATHRAIGGFDERYRGWGAEDTDYGLAAERAGVLLCFVAGAWAYHQHHPPIASVNPAALVANANRFRTRWGYWPMPDRLHELADAGQIEFDPGRDLCREQRPAAPKDDG